MKLLVLGEPGVGKSTVANSWIGSEVFKSGPHHHGDWSELTTSTFVRGMEIVDVPGYNDSRARSVGLASLAVEEISEAPDTFVVLFVVEMPSWELKVSDACAMANFANRIHNTSGCSIKFGVIINKVSAEFAKKMNKPNRKWTAIQNRLSRYCCDQILLVQEHRMSTKRKLLLPDEEIEKIQEFVRTIPRTFVAQKVGRVDFDCLKKEKLVAAEKELTKWKTSYWGQNRLIRFQIQHKSKWPHSIMIAHANEKWRVSKSETLACDMDVLFGVVAFSVFQDWRRYDYRVSLLDCECSEQCVIQLNTADRLLCDGAISYGSLSLESTAKIGAIVGIAFRANPFVGVITGLLVLPLLSL
eukprot:CAMPEP_0182447902 /NCGR_PEP_ID=MMETSP1172-20130603/21529_1 /TAXON_ID=708627 /ORGANISM="Timspurckia oligopyrenoides, Strain CCMP3278" /LENGTH=355 /DNA_ID=CAMNT_0024644541 /DNA_START=569 /DNA_END=1636 /DNA_ORIENTATION=-